MSACTEDIDRAEHKARVTKVLESLDMYDPINYYVFVYAYLIDLKANFFFDVGSKTKYLTF